MSRWLAERKGQAATWLRQGVSPRRLALTLALGFAIGCIPVVGVPTALCAMVALGIRLNLAAIQAANLAATPLQVALILPFMRLGGRLVASRPHAEPALGSLLHGSALSFLTASGSLAGQALMGWLVIAAPAVVVMTLGLTTLLQRVPALAAEAGD
ncbi:MAG: DUF2062 domain-containing protein [Terracidiphilus sp.]|jgi:uncharacterized protein (DUF2062 family)